MRPIFILCSIMLVFWAINYFFGSFFSGRAKRNAFYFFLAMLGAVVFTIVFTLLKGFFGVAIPMSILLLIALVRRKK